jgi:hypothetical protein
LKPLAREGGGRCEEKDSEKKVITKAVDLVLHILNKINRKHL